MLRALLGFRKQPEEAGMTPMWQQATESQRDGMIIGLRGLEYFHQEKDGLTAKHRERYA